MIDISTNIRNKRDDYNYYTSYVLNKEKNNSSKSVIPKKYHDYIEKILNNQCEIFKENYNNNLENNSFKKIE
jgi:hypothetical protein